MNKTSQNKRQTTFGEFISTVRSVAKSDHLTTLAVADLIQNRVIRFGKFRVRVV